MTDHAGEAPRGRGGFTYRFESKHGKLSWREFCNQMQAQFMGKSPIMGRKWKRMAALRIENDGSCPTYLDLPPDQRIGDARKHPAVAANG